MDSVPHQPSLAPDTTHQQDLTLGGQRYINRIFEWTQAMIALMVVFAVSFNTMWNSIYNLNRQPDAFMGGIAMLIIKSYYDRTNGHLIGGTGPKANEPNAAEYKGR